MAFENIESLSGLEESLKVEFICSECGKTGFKKVENLKKNFKCRSCNAKFARSKVDTSKIDYKKVAETARKNNLKKYGVENPMQLKEFKDRVKESNLKKYGCHPSQLQEVKNKQAKTNIERYGSKSAFQNEDVKAKFRKSCEKKYGEGILNPFQDEKVKEKIKNTLIEHYGVDNPQKNKEILSNTKKTCLEKYGIECCFNLHNKALYTFDNINFDSKPELAFYIYNIDNGIKIEKNKKFFTYTFENKEHKYYPDFEIDGKFIEIKGDHFLKENGEWQNPFDHSLDGLYEEKHKCALKNNVEILYSKDCAGFIEYVDNKYTKDYLDLFKTDLEFPYLNQDLKDISDIGIIRHFHKSIYDASKKGLKSPRSAWEDKELIKKVAENRLKYVGSCRPSDILQGFSVTRLAPKISVFSPKLGEKLISKYLDNFSEIVDPFSGFSGRLIASANLGKTYIGKDINESHIKESNDIIEYKKYRNVSVSKEDLLTKNDIEEYECLFTCPPYGGKEHWNKNNNEIEKSCDEWIDICLQKYKCKKYLFVVDETEKYINYIVDFDLGKKDGLFHKYNEKVLLIEV